MTQPVHILLVDDEALMRKYLGRLLESAGYQVTAVASAPDALSAIEGSRFHLALIDVIMPGMGGLELLRRLKEADPDVVVIMMTGYSALQFATEAIRYGAYRYLTKPFEGREQVLAVVREGLAQHPDIEST
jgi:DNA-binding NtrC family response regulator